MQGEMVAEFTGKVTGTRVLPGDDYRYVKMEISFQASGKLLGADAMNIGTYVLFERVPGQVYGEGQGMVQTADGQGAIWNGHGVATMTGEGMASKDRFSLAVQAPTSGPMARLNGVLLIGENEVDAEGNMKQTLWEWK